jgi:hypothetical protein
LGEFSDQVLLADNLDSATAFFYAFNQLIRATPPDTCRTSALSL